MDYQYDFRQAYRNRLEEAGIVKYQPKDGFGVRKAQARRRSRPFFASLIGLFVR